MNVYIITNKMNKNNPPKNAMKALYSPFFLFYGLGVKRDYLDVSSVVGIQHVYPLHQLLVELLLLVLPLI